MNNLVEAFEKRKNEKKQKEFISNQKNYQSTQVIDVPKGLYEKCPKCKETVNTNHLRDGLFLCKHCNEHFRVRAIDRIQITLDNNSFVEKGLGFITLNPLFTEDYEDKISDYQEKTGLD